MVRFGTVDHLEGGDEFPIKIARYMVDNSVTMEDVPVPVFTLHLILCEVGAGHLEQITPGALNDTVSAMYFGRGYNNIGLFVVYPSEELSPDELAIKVGV